MVTEQDLLAYLLDGLDDAEQRQLERALEESPALRNQLVRLRLVLQPLEADAAEIEPPADLHLRTLRRVAHLRVAEPARKIAPPVTASERLAPRRWWRRADVLVAAGILFVLGMFVPVLILQVRREAGITACADNLRNWHLALKQYQDQHGGFLPIADEDGPLNVAGAAAVKLRDQGYWRDGMRINCPGRARELVVVPPAQSQALALASQAKDDRWCQQLSGCYATPLGYYSGPDGRELRNVHVSLGSDYPVLVDRPARLGETSDAKAGNSPNHGFRGQNVLLQGGEVRFLPGRTLPIGTSMDSDLFRNERGELAPGLHSGDAVLVPSEVRLPPKAVFSQPAPE